MKIALVFSGGALRGFAQFGAYKAIEEFLKKNNAVVTTVVGTSFGSITASLIALGYNSTEMNYFAKQNGLKLANFKDLKISGPGLLKGKKIQKELQSIIGNKNFSETKIKLVINTVDIKTGKEFIFTKKGLKAVDGSEEIDDTNVRITTAINASTAIPAVFAPVKKYNKLLVDGGLVNPLCVKTLDLRKYDYVIGVDVSTSNFDFITNDNPNKLQMIMQSISIAQRQFHFKTLEEYKRNNSKFCLIRPDVGPVKPKRKNEMKRIIEVGYQEAKRILKM